MAKLLNGKNIAKSYRETLKQQVSELKEKGVTPNLTVVLVGEDGASKSYVNAKHKACQSIGMDSVIKHFDADITEEALLKEIKALNEDTGVHGILVQVPLPTHIDEHLVLETIDPSKDVDGFHPENIGKMHLGIDTFAPCTPLGIMHLIKETGIDIAGKNALVIGRSHIVGQPVAQLLLNESATVMIAHSKTQNLESLLGQADIVVSAVGQPGLVSGEHLKDGVIAIDVGNTVVDGKLVGDFDFDSVSDKASYITPVPGGVGPMTITYVLNNTVRACREQI